VDTISPHPSYRPHDPGHNYYAPGIYLITLVVRDRRTQSTLLGAFNDNISNPSVTHTETGRAVLEEWQKIPVFEASKGRHIKVHAAVCMPDHFHGVIEVQKPMDVSVGQVIWGFKVACTKRWRQAQLEQPSLVVQTNSHPSSKQPSLVAPDLHRMSKKQRALYYAQHPEAQQPLWDDNYDDTICLNDPTTNTYSQRHFTAMLRYVADNPRRAIIRRMRPQYMRRSLCVRIGTRLYAAFGNLFLLRWPRKIQVFCHRKLPGTTTPYETTPAYQSDHDKWIANIMQGATVIVTPGISKGELLMKNECIDHGYPLIHIQKEPIGRYWKPEQSRFDACANGSLLILAPWAPDQLGDFNHIPSNTDYSIFHNLNNLAAEICQFDGDAVIVDGKNMV